MSAANSRERLCGARGSPFGLVIIDEVSSVLKILYISSTVKQRLEAIGSLINALCGATGVVAVDADVNANAIELIRQCRPVTETSMLYRTPAGARTSPFENVCIARKAALIDALRGSDVLKHNPLIREIDYPFSGRRIHAVGPIRPRVT